jgi:hypothetical protein
VERVHGVARREGSARGRRAEDGWGGHGGSPPGVTATGRLRTRSSPEGTVSGDAVAANPRPEACGLGS